MTPDERKAASDQYRGIGQRPRGPVATKVESEAAVMHTTAMHQFASNVGFFTFVALVILGVSLLFRTMAIGLWAIFALVTGMQVVIDLLKIPFLLRAVAVEGIDRNGLVATSALCGKDVV